MNDHSGISLSGEIDKRGHLEFDHEDQKNPDFVFHIPGTMSGNTIVVEVKGKLDNPDGIKKDFEKLHTFMAKYQYQAGFFILFNHGVDELMPIITDRILGIDGITTLADSIFIISQQSPKSECIVTTLERITNKAIKS